MLTYPYLRSLCYLLTLLKAFCLSLLKCALGILEALTKLTRKPPQACFHMNALETAEIQVLL